MFPDGVNVEFVVRVGDADDRHVRMRVHERGVGETLSCGTGAARGHGRRSPRATPRPTETAYTVDVPGGRVVVTRDADEHLGSAARRSSSAASPWAEQHERRRDLETDVDDGLAFTAAAGAARRRASAAAS